MKLKFNEKIHAYWLDGKRCKGVTTVAKIPDDTYRLEAWTARQVAVGMALSPELVESVAAHFDDYQKVTDAVEDAKKAAGAHIGSTRGTALHRITERVDLGERIIPTPLSAYVVASWQAALDAADLEVIPDFVERAVVYPDRLIAGRFDRIVRRRSDGRLFIGDVKGGERAIQYPHSMACQLAMYANAPLVCGQWGSGDGETEIFDPMPDVDKEWGYIFHLPESGEAAVARVNIAAGWDITQRAVFPILKWRDLHDLCQPVATIVAGGEQVPVSSPVEPAPPGDVDPTKETTCSPTNNENTSSPSQTNSNPSPSKSVSKSAETKSNAPPESSATSQPKVDRRNALIARVKDLSDEQRQEMARRWPEGVSTFKASPSHSDTDLDAIELILGGIDLGGAVDNPEEGWGPKDDQSYVPPAPEWAEPDSDLISEQEYEAVKMVFTTYGPEVRSMVGEWADEAKAGGRPFTPRDKGTERRVAIIGAACMLADEVGDQAIIREILGWLTGGLQETVPTGMALGSLTLDEARRAQAFAEHFGKDIAVIYGADGVLFDGPGLAAVA